MTISETRALRIEGAPWFAPISSLPELPKHFLRRERLESRISQGLSRRLTLVTGMAGAGKSVLVAGWAHQRARDATAYLALETDDNEPHRFWRRLVAALRVVDPEVGDNVLAALAVGMEDAQLAEVLATETALMGPVVIVIDGLQMVTDRGLTKAVDYLAAHLPSQVHLIITTRGSCRGEFHRLRLTGDLNEIGDADLRFSDDEANLLLSRVAGVQAASDAIAALVARTEGWAAGLIMAAMSATDEGAISLGAFAGNSGLVDEYFEREVLHDQPGETVQYLVETSVLEAMTADLCRHVTGRADACQVLEHLAERHLFLRPMEGEDGSYRYHRLFADFLRLRAASRQPEVVRQAHARAAEWWQSNARNGIAFAHLLKAEAHQEALALGAATAVQQLDHTQPMQDGLLPGDLPVTYLESDPWRMYVIGAALLARRQPGEAARWLRRLGRGFGDERPHPGPDLPG